MYSYRDAATYSQTKHGLGGESPPGDSFARVGEEENCHDHHSNILTIITMAQVHRPCPVANRMTVHFVVGFLDTPSHYEIIKIADIHLFLIMCVMRKLKSPFVVTFLRGCDAMDHPLAPRITTAFP